MWKDLGASEKVMVVDFLVVEFIYMKKHWSRNTRKRKNKNKKTLKKKD